MKKATEKNPIDSNYLLFLEKQLFQTIFSSLFCSVEKQPQ